LRFSSNYLESQPKIIYRQTANRIIAALDNSGNYLNKTVHLIVPKTSWNKFPEKLLLGLLNSSVLNYIYTHISQETGKRAFAQVKTTYIKKLPIPKMTNIFDTNRLIQLVDKILTTKQENPKADTSILESKIDKLVYQLYELTDEEIRIVEGDGS